MFTASISPIDYIDPWLAPYHERFAALLRGSPRVAYLCWQPESTTFRYRAYNMIEALSLAEPGASAASFLLDDEDGLDRVIENADVLVLCRLKYDHKLACLIEMARRR